MDVISLASRLPQLVLGSKSDDDFSDRLNYKYTVALLVLFSVVIQTRLFGSDVIRCWVPAHFTSNYEQYVSQICWISNTYFYEMNQSIPKSEVERSKNEIKYYQWVSFVLLVQALLFYFPRILWRTLSIKAGLNIGDLVDAAISYKSSEKFDKQNHFMSYMVKNIDQYVDDDRRYAPGRQKNAFIRFILACTPCFGRYLGNYIVLLYFVIKVVYMLNTIIQIFIISALLGNNFLHFGLDFIGKMWRGEGWTVTNSKYFPKVTLCDFLIREVGNPNKSHKYTVQCVLPINLFNQQIFTAIWFWYLFVLACNVFELIKWLQRAYPSKANAWIEKRVQLIHKTAKIGKNRLKHFLDKYLEPDGIFMIRMIGNNTSDYVATDLIQQLWCQHAESYDSMFPGEPHSYPDIPCKFVHVLLKKRAEKTKADADEAFSQRIQAANLADGHKDYFSFGQVYNGQPDVDQLQRHILMSGQRTFAGGGGGGGGGGIRGATNPLLPDEQNYSNEENSYPRRRESNFAINNPNVNGSTNV